MEVWWTAPWPRRFVLFAALLRHGGMSEWRWGIARLLPYKLFLSLGALWALMRTRGAHSHALAPREARPGVN
jgi:hypothetical protein